MTNSLSLVGNIKITSGGTEVLSDALSVSDDFVENNVQNITIDASAVDQAINFAGVAIAQQVYIVPAYESSGFEYVTVKINGGSDDIPVGKLSVLSGKGSNGISSLTVTNPDTVNPVQLKIYIA